MTSTAQNLIVPMGEMMTAFRTAFGARRALFVKGPPGIGKSDMADQWADLQGDDYCICELNAALANLPDVIGVLMPGAETFIMPDGREVTITTGQYAYPYWLRDKRTGKPAFLYKRGLLVVEEYGQAALDLKRGLAGVIWNGRAGTHEIPPGFDVLILSNRAEDRSGVGKDYDFLINRRIEIEVKPDPNAWVIWASANGVSSTAIAFADRRKAEVFESKMPEAQGPWITPRSLVSLDAFYQQAHLKDNISLDEPFFFKMAAGIVGQGSAHTFIAFAKLRDKLPLIRDIIKDPVGTHMPSEPDQMMFLAFDLASAVSRATMKPIIQYMHRMPNDFSIAFFKSAMQRDKSLRSTAEFGDWSVKNIQLLSAIAGT